MQIAQRNIYKQNLMKKPAKPVTSGMRDFHVHKKIGDGAYSIVYQVTRKHDNQEYALKQVSRRVMDYGSRNESESSDCFVDDVSRSKFKSYQIKRNKMRLTRFESLHLCSKYKWLWLWWD